MTIRNLKWTFKALNFLSQLNPRKYKLLKDSLYDTLDSGGFNWAKTLRTNYYLGHPVTGKPISNMTSIVIDFENGTYHINEPKKKSHHGEDILTEDLRNYVRYQEYADEF